MELQQDEVESMARRITGNSNLQLFGHYDQLIENKTWRNFYIQNATVQNYIILSWKIRNTKRIELGDYTEDANFLDVYRKNLKEDIWNKQIDELFTMRLRID